MSYKGIRGAQALLERARRVCLAECVKRDLLISAHLQQVRNRVSQNSDGFIACAEPSAAVDHGMMLWLPSSQRGEKGLKCATACTIYLCRAKLQHVCRGESVVPAAMNITKVMTAVLHQMNSHRL